MIFLSFWQQPGTLILPPLWSLRRCRCRAWTARTRLSWLIWFRPLWCCWIYRGWGNFQPFVPYTLALKQWNHVSWQNKVQTFWMKIDIFLIAISGRRCRFTLQYCLWLVFQICFLNVKPNERNLHIGGAAQCPTFSTFEQVAALEMPECRLKYWWQPLGIHFEVSLFSREILLLNSF